MNIRTVLNEFKFVCMRCKKPLGIRDMIIDTLDTYGNLLCPSCGMADHIRADLTNSTKSLRLEK